MVNFPPVLRTNFIHIDESLANSRLQWLVWGGLMLLISVIIVGLNLPTSYQLALIVLLILCVAVTQLSAYQLTAISTLPLAKNSANDNLGDVEWQLGITSLELRHFFRPNQQTAKVWQATLCKANDYQVAIVLTFAVIVPVQRQLTLIIWQDQVSADAWRQLSVLAHL